MKQTLLISTILLSISNIAPAYNNNSISCTDWPEWTPMYWMQEMVGIECEENGRLPYYPPYARNMQGYQQSPYVNSFSKAPPLYNLPYSPASSLFSPQSFSNNRSTAWNTPFSPYQRRSSLWNSGTNFPQFGGNNMFPMSNRFNSPMNIGMNPMSMNSPFGGANPMSMGSPYGGMNPMAGSMMPMNMGMNPMSMGSPFGGANPMGMGSPFGGVNPMSMGSPFGGANPMNMGSPFGGGFGMPYGSPMSPMGGMTPFGGSPFGGRSMNPFNRGMMRSF